jgi:HSP20 family protein
MRLITTKMPAPVAGVPELERFIDRFFGAPLLGHGLPPMETAWVPPLDYVETEKAFIVRLEVPGIPKENLDINLEGLVLTVTGHREAVKEFENENVIVNERMMGRFVRALRLPVPVLEEKIEATVHDGVMVITLPKMTVAPKSRITIK